MYYVLSYTVPEDDDGGYFHVRNGVQIEGVRSWSVGARFEVEIPEPIEIEVLPVDGYSGSLSDLYGGNICLMSPRLVDALRSAGVDNLDVYRAVLRNAETGETYDFRAVNIIGLVGAADLGKSEWTSYDGDGLIDVNFDSLEVDERKAGGLGMFRLAENTTTILISEAVKDHLAAEEFPTLTFVDPEQWIT